MLDTSAAQKGSRCPGAILKQLQNLKVNSSFRKYVEALAAASCCVQCKQAWRLGCVAESMKSSALLKLDMRNSASTFAEAQVKRKALLPCKQFNKAVQLHASILEGMRRGCSKTF